MMRLPEFKDRVKDAFGEHLQHATPANVREFLDQLQKDVWAAQRAESSSRSGGTPAPYDIPSESESVTWESLVRDFFTHALETEPEQALMMLWIFGLDLAYSGIEELHADNMNRLFRDMPG